MKKILGIPSIFLLSLALALPAYAQVSISDCVPGLNNNYDPRCNPHSDLAKIVGYLVILGVIVALFFTIYGILRLIKSGKAKTKRKAAKKIIILAIIGFFLVMFVYFIASVIAGAFGINITFSDVFGTYIMWPNSSMHL